MSIIKGMLQEEYNRLSSLLKKYEAEEAGLPSGSLSIKEKSGNSYAYLARRSGNKVVFKYLGRASSEEVRQLRASIQKRNDCRKKIKIIKNDIKELERALGGRKI